MPGAPRASGISTYAPGVHVCQDFPGGPSRSSPTYPCGTSPSAPTVRSRAATLSGTRQPTNTAVPAAVRCAGSGAPSPIRARTSPRPTRSFTDPDLPTARAAHSNLAAARPRPSARSLAASTKLLVTSLGR